MSANYHAYQSRKVLFSDSEAGSQQWWDRFKDYDANYEDALAKLKAAGIDEYVAEVQRQLDEFFEVNGYNH